MKRTHYILLFLFSILWTTPNLDGQTPTDIPEVSYEQGKIIGNLPYGRHYYIIGNSKLPGGNRADQVKVKIWSTGRTVFNRKKKLKSLDGNTIASVLANPPLDSAIWAADRTDDTNTYRLYMNKQLQFSSEYMLEFTFSEVVNFDFSEDEKDLVIGKIQSKSLAIYQQKGGINVNEIQDVINEVVTGYLADQDEYGNLFEGGTTTKSSYSNLPISQVTLTSLSQAIGAQASKQELINVLTPQIKDVKSEMDDLPADSPDRSDYEAEIASLTAQLNKAQTELDQAKKDLPELLKIIRSKLIETYSSYVITSPEELSVTELNAIRIGTSFGGGMVGFNTFDENRDLDVFGYTALKFYLLPVDKRIADPYLTGAFFINKVAILAGVSVSGDLNYHGQVLDKAVGFYPIAGLSYDVNRYLSIDVGATLFKQSSISPLTNDSDIRVGPVIGINFDGDLFNRFNALFSGDGYKINPGN